jgi:heat shock protein HtpX
MPQPIDSYSASAADWRGSIAKNSRRTFYVIVIFFSIYIFLGLLVDSFMASATYPQATIPDLLNAIFTLQIFPLATFIMVAVAAFSLYITFAFSDKLMLLGTEYKEISPASKNSENEMQLYNVVEEMKIAAGLNFMPRVYIIDAPYMNAFASGYSEKSAMVAITRGLMEKLNRSELSAVMAHELSHIRHMDIKLTLMASVLANLILMVLDMFFYSALYSQRDSESRSRNSLFMIIMVVRYVLPVINILLLLYLSRTREYMADAGSVELMRDNQPLATALLKIQDDHISNEAAYSAAYQQTPHENVRREAYIFDPVQAGVEPMTSLADAFSTHPNIQSRLSAIGFKRNR